MHAHLGTSLPDDYRGYLDAYGLGCINGLYWATHPHAQVDRLNLLTQWAVRDPGPLLTPPPHPLGLVPGGLVPCAVDEDGGVLYWHANSPDPNRWTVVYRDEDGDAWRPYGLGLVAFLYEVFTDALPELGYAAAGYLTRPLSFDPTG